MTAKVDFAARPKRVAAVRRTSAMEMKKLGAAKT